jgi:hypothetical protein
MGKFLLTRMAAVAELEAGLIGKQKGNARAVAKIREKAALRAFKASLRASNATSNGYFKPGMIWIAHIGRDLTSSNFPPIRAIPHYAAPTDIGAELDEALSSKRIEIEL